MRKKYFRVQMYIENDKGEFEPKALYEGQNTLSGIRKLLTFYEKIYKWDYGKKSTQPKGK